MEIDRQKTAQYLISNLLSITIQSELKTERQTHRRRLEICSLKMSRSIKKWYSMDRKTEDKQTKRQTNESVQKFLDL
jgi:hypothetical protein